MAVPLEARVAYVSTEAATTCTPPAWPGEETRTWKFFTHGRIADVVRGHVDAPLEGVIFVAGDDPVQRDEPDRSLLAMGRWAGTEIACGAETLRAGAPIVVGGELDPSTPISDIEWQDVLDGLPETSRPVTAADVSRLTPRDDL